MDSRRVFKGEATLSVTRAEQSRGTCTTAGRAADENTAAWSSGRPFDADTQTHTRLVKST